MKKLPLAELYSKIEKLKTKLDASRPLTAGELEHIHNNFTTEYTYNSNAIEGNTLSLRETEMVLRGLTVDKKPLKDHLEATQHRDAFEFVTSIVKDREPLNERVICEIHSIVLNHQPDDRGKYRRVAVRILGASHIPPQPHKIAEQMSALLTEYTAKPVTPATIVQFHLEFERIHPFIDGNGRTGRLIANLELMKLGYPPIDIKFADRMEYYNAFEQFDTENSTENMERLFADRLLKRLEEYLQMIK
jgi:Fic family protein